MDSLTSPTKASVDTSASAESLDALLASFDSIASKQRANETEKEALRRSVLSSEATMARQGAELARVAAQNSRLEKLASEQVKTNGKVAF